MPKFQRDYMLEEDPDLEGSWMRNLI